MSLYIIRAACPKYDEKDITLVGDEATNDDNWGGRRLSETATKNKGRKFILYKAIHESEFLPPVAPTGTIVTKRYGE